VIKEHNINNKMQIMNKIEINDENGDLKDYLVQYKVWNQSKKNTFPDISNTMNGIPVYNFRNVKAINSCNSSLIIIECITEGLHSYKYFNQYCLEKQYIIITNDIWDKETDTLINKNLQYEIIWHPFFLFDMCNTWFNSYRFHYYSDKIYSFCYPKLCIFISTIGNERKKRTLFVDQLIKHISYKNYILRYSGKDLGMASDQYDLLTFEEGSFDSYANIFSLPHYNLSNTIPINIYNQGYFNLVMETDIDFDNFFLTEKTFKSILSGMPFVVIASPTYLANLHRLGFKTYNELWDESYDDEYNTNRRFEKIITLCNELETFDWNGNKKKLQDIYHANIANLLTTSTIMDKGFVKFSNVLKDKILKDKNVC